MILRKNCPGNLRENIREEKISGWIPVSKALPAVPSDNRIGELSGSWPEYMCRVQSGGGSEIFSCAFSPNRKWLRNGQNFTSLVTDWYCMPEEDRKETDTEAAVQYGGFVTNRLKNKQECIFTTECSSLLCRNRTLEKAETYPDLYDKDVTVKQRIVQTRAGQWMSCKD